MHSPFSLQSLVDCLQQKPCSLGALDLRFNNIALLGCRLLGTLLKSKNASLEVLELGGNDEEEALLQVLILCLHGFLLCSSPWED